MSAIKGDLRALKARCISCGFEACGAEDGDFVAQVAARHAVVTGHTVGVGTRLQTQGVGNGRPQCGRQPRGDAT